MRDESDKRRRQDMRDFEFFRRRMRPTATQLWRLIDKPNDINVITEVDRQSRERSGGCRSVSEPSVPKQPILNDHPRPEWRQSQRLRQQAVEMVEAEVIWPLVAALVVLGLIGWTGNIDSVMSTITF